MTASIPTPPEGYVLAGPVSDFMPKDGQPSEQTKETVSTESDHNITNEEGSPCAMPDQNIKVIEVDQPEGCYPSMRRVAITFYHGKWYAFLNICPHQGSALSGGLMMDIEDMGIVWGAGVSCKLHGWTFDVSSGQSESTRFVLDTYEVKVVDDYVFVSQLPKNSHVQGPRRDFGGKELN